MSKKGGLYSFWRGTTTNQNSENYTQGNNETNILKLLPKLGILINANKAMSVPNLNIQIYANELKS